MMTKNRSFDIDWQSTWVLVTSSFSGSRALGKDQQSAPKRARSSFKVFSRFCPTRKLRAFVEPTLITFGFILTKLPNDRTRVDAGHPLCLAA